MSVALESLKVSAMNRLWISQEREEMEEFKQAYIRPAKQETQSPQDAPIKPKSAPMEEVLFNDPHQDQIRERLAPAFYYNAYRGRRLTFVMKNGAEITGNVLQQRWEFLELRNAIIVTKDGQRTVSDMMINVNRIEYSHAPGPENGKHG